MLPVPNRTGDIFGTASIANTVWPKCETEPQPSLQFCLYCHRADNHGPVYIHCLPIQSLSNPVSFHWEVLHSHNLQNCSLKLSLLSVVYVLLLLFWFVSCCLVFVVVVVVL